MTEITHPPVQEALEHLNTLYSDEELRLAAERREQALIDAEDMLDQARYEGEQKGLRKGLEQGQLEGTAQVLAMQLTRKFGALPDWVRQRLDHADEAALNNWATQLLDAQRIEDVFVEV